MDIAAYKSDEAFIKETALQIIKDFDLYGITIVFSGNTDTAYEELKGQLTDCIQELLTGDIHKFFSLLYRIDVLDWKIKKASNFSPKEKRPALFADLIIERELQKVVIRKLFSKPPSSEEA